MYWLENDNDSFTLRSNKGEDLGLAALDNGEYHWYAYDYTVLNANERWGCVRLGPFDSADAAQVALEGHVREGNE